MTRGFRLVLVGSFILVSLAGCGRGFFQTAEREPWRAEAEAACLKSGVVKENADLVRIDPISGPGICGAEFPLKVAALGESNASLGYVDDLRPPNTIGNAQPRWPVTQPQPSYAHPSYSSPSYSPPLASSSYPAAVPQTSAPAGAPMPLNVPGVAPPPDDEDDAAYSAPASRYPNTAPQSRPPYAAQPSQPSYSQPRLGPAGNPVSSLGPVALKPTATLACPIVSVLDRWLADSVQPAAMRWFGARVVEIKQISAYSCRGMNGNSNAHISEHAFGNALDIAAFTLADGRRISVQDGWKGLPEEQGFLRDVQAAACQQFTTVLAPGSNVYHYNHIHVDLMRRASGRIICQPSAVSGEEVAARASPRGYAGRDGFRDSGVTGSISLGGRKRRTAGSASLQLSKQDADTIEDESRLSDHD
ncbi:MAG: extensin family protein [Xanthobacteraceae bacterium]|nr:extensin family protein [Xanthobacteraceae bacterium]